MAQAEIGIIGGSGLYQMKGLTDLHEVATALTAAALAREETRGAHWREDFPDASDAWRGHLVTTLAGTTFERLPA